MVVAKRINIASYRVLTTLLCLFKSDYTMSELVSLLEEAGYGPYNNFIVSKYIHTLRACGIDIQKIDNRYCIINFPIGMKFSSTDAQLLYDIKLKGEKMALDGTGYPLVQFFNKIHLPFYKSGTGLHSSQNFNAIKHLEQAYKTDSQVILTYMDDRQEGCFVRDIKIVHGKYYFVVANKNSVKEINPDDVVNVELLNKKMKINVSNVGVTFELLGKLAERYQLRENEHIIKYKDNGSIVILNEYEDRHVLIQRLLRYDSSCKVIGPADFLKQYRDIINGSLENYNVDPQRKSQKALAQELAKQKENAKKMKKVKKEE